VELTPRRILVYKRTHIGDPNPEGIFGCHDCMRSVRAKQYDAVIGVGGVGHEPQSHGIDRRITWVGVGPTRHQIDGKIHPTVSFERFFLYEANGPALDSVAPSLARRMYGGPDYKHHVRYVLNLTDEERGEALRVLDLTASPDWVAREQRG